MYRQICTRVKKKFDVLSFEAHSRNTVPSNPSGDDEALEKIYWEQRRELQPLYAADIDGSLMNCREEPWNFSHLRTPLDSMTLDKGKVVPGLNLPFLYFGMWGSTFGWHSEDFDLLSINYHHFGAPKLWYAISSDESNKLISVLQEEYAEDYKRCDSFERHKMAVIHPDRLLVKRVSPATRSFHSLFATLSVFLYYSHSQKVFWYTFLLSIINHQYSIIHP